MNNYLLKLRIPALVLVLLAGSYWANAQKVAIANGDWSQRGTWGGPAPTAGQTVTIGNGITVTIDIDNAACASLTMPSGNDYTTLTIPSGKKLTVGGAISLGAPSNGNSHRTINVDGTLEAGSITMANVNNGGGYDDIRVYVNNGGTLDVKGNVA